MRCKRHGTTIQHIAHAILNGQEGNRPLFSDSKTPGGCPMPFHAWRKLSPATPYLTLSSSPSWNSTESTLAIFQKVG
jgi:hypothetical protein